MGAWVYFTWSIDKAQGQNIRRGGGGDEKRCREKKRFLTQGNGELDRSGMEQQGEIYDATKRSGATGMKQRGDLNRMGLIIWF